ncbi:nucleotidyl transferase AbiEii/AbiGii toxin family protein [Deinococcus marmoris]|uniref:nucleotidyl transferase AbiEii/AbiGii toxin family protein n=1 Tax=Deinococcus marmoris TaxID=249408 RepID=UPI00096A2BAD|nr:nucleotidyl transferase AbiEii/AbiGii toxin family protein [Deinococcus marmoris]
MKYASPRAFRNALTSHLRARATREGMDLARLQRQLAYERFLNRLFGVVGEAWVLKGGYALELRLGGRARATKDLDFNAPGGGDLLEVLQDAAELDLADHFRFVVEVPERGALAGPPEGGQRFRVTARLDSNQPFTTFLVDVGQGDIVHTTLDRLPPQVDVSFAGLPPTTFPIYPLPEHFAEKLHAYTRPRPGGGQTRVKDLLDLSLIVTELQLQPSREVWLVLDGVFTRYASHTLPSVVPDPPADWRGPYQAMATEIDHPVTDMDETVAAVQRFLDACQPR